nr:hypothetical protein BDZ91DRAFT_721630 [Kalaharituber pfeilii]
MMELSSSCLSITVFSSLCLLMTVFFSSCLLTSSLRAQHSRAPHARNNLPQPQPRM